MTSKTTAVITIQSQTESLYLVEHWNSFHYALDQKGERGPCLQLTDGMLAVNSTNTIPQKPAQGDSLNNSRREFTLQQCLLLCPQVHEMSVDNILLHGSLHSVL